MPLSCRVTPPAGRPSRARAASPGGRAPGYYTPHSEIDALLRQATPRRTAASAPAAPPNSAPPPPPPAAAPIRPVTPRAKPPRPPSTPSSSGRATASGSAAAAAPRRHAADDMVVPTLAHRGAALDPLRGGSASAAGLVPIGRDSPIGLNLDHFMGSPSPFGQPTRGSRDLPDDEARSCSLRFSSSSQYSGAALCRRPTPSRHRRSPLSPSPPTPCEPSFPLASPTFESSAPCGRRAAPSARSQRCDILRRAPLCRACSRRPLRRRAHATPDAAAVARTGVGPRRAAGARRRFEREPAGAAAWRRPRAPPGTTCLRVALTPSQCPARPAFCDVLFTRLTHRAHTPFPDRRAGLPARDQPPHRLLLRRLPPLRPHHHRLVAQAARALAAGNPRGCARRRFSRRRRWALPRKRWSRSRVGGAARSLRRDPRRPARAAAEVGGAGGGKRALGAAGGASGEDPRSVDRRLMCVRTVPIVTLGLAAGAAGGININRWLAHSWIQSTRTFLRFLR